MATADRILQLKLISDVSDINRGLKGTQSRMRSMAAGAARWGKAITAGLVLKGVDVLVDSLGDAMEGFREGEDAARRLGQTWKNLGRDTDGLTRTIDSLSERALSLGFDDAEVLTAFNTYLTKTGSVSKSLKGVQAAMDLARARNIPFSRAVKIVTGSLGDLDAELKRNRRQARIWARNHPLEVRLNRIGDLWETFVGEFSKGRIKRALAALGNIGATIGEVLFGSIDEETGKKTPGVVDNVAKLLTRMADELTGGAASTFLTQLGDGLKYLADQARPLTDALSTLWDDLLAPMIAELNKNGALAAAALGLLAIGIAALVLPTIAATAPFIILAGIIGAIIAGVVLLVQKLPDIQHALQDVQKGVQPILDTISGAFDTAFEHINNLIGTLSNTVNFLLEQWNNLLGLMGQGDSAPTNRTHGGPGGRRGGGRGAGEGATDWPTLPDHFLGAGVSGGGGGITVNVSAGVGDPVAIGRAVDRVLRAYRGRAGVPL